MRAMRLGRGGLVGVYPAPRRDEDRVRAQLRGAGVVEDVRAALAADRAVPPAPVAAARPRGQARACRRQVGGGVHALAAPLPRRGHEPVRRHLRAHRRGRPAQLPRYPPARGPSLQHPLDRVPLVPGEPAVGPRGRLPGPLLPLSGHVVLRSPGAGRSGPQGIGFPHSSVHVRMNVGGVRMKSPIKASIASAASSNLATGGTLLLAYNRCSHTTSGDAHVKHPSGGLPRFYLRYRNLF